jgi:phage terminase large subunit-like protein
MLWMINNTECYTDPNGNIKLKKSSKSSSQRIDGVISSLMAHGVSINPEINQIITPISFEKLKAIL